MRTVLRWALIPMAVVALAACGDRDSKVEAPKAEPSTRTLAAAVDGSLARVVDNAGLKDALEGVGPYTLFAPPDAVLKDGGADFTDPAMKAQGVALLKAHIVPGTVTRADIASAIDRAGDKGAQLRTMSGDVLTFTREGEGLVATSPDGARARLTGDESLVSNGALQPVDGLLLKSGAPAAAG